MPRLRESTAVLLLSLGVVAATPVAQPVRVADGEARPRLPAPNAPSAGEVETGRAASSLVRDASFAPDARVVDGSQGAAPKRRAAPPRAVAGVTEEARAATARDPIARLEAAAAEAERALRAGDLGVAETGYRAVAAAGWLLSAEALIANRQPDAALRELEGGHRLVPDDAELVYALAAGYLRMKVLVGVGVAEGEAAVRAAAERTAGGRADDDPERAAAALFDRLVAIRPGAETLVLIGRTWRDARAFERARGALRAAIALDARVRRAHYYLGMVTVMDEGAARLDEAIAEFREELRIAPADPNANLALGMALVETQRPAEALPPLREAARSPTAPANAFLYLGRCQAALGHPAEAASSLRRALALARAEAAHGTGSDEARLGAIHYQLATALRSMGRADEAASEFAEAERVLAERASNTRERLTRYLADIPDTPLATSPLAPPTAAAAQRAERLVRVRAVVARACFNLGIMQAQANRFPVAANWFEQAGGADPAFPRLAFSLGVARFNARQYDKAVEPLTRALAAEPGDATARRMLALARFNTEAYGAAADLLRDDPQRDADPSLQYIYGLALVRSDRAAEAEATFSRLLQSHRESAELTVVLGMAYAQQGDHDNAIATLKRALALKPDVADANATLGLLYLKQGRLPEAAAALRAELRSHPDDVRARHTLATVLDLDGQPDEAITLLRAVLAVRPDHADAHYLFGKILLAQGHAPEAVAQLETAVRLAPDEANTHYQLAQAYTKLGRTADAEREFNAFRELKDKRRERTP